jgi:hypothetical protein
VAVIRELLGLGVIAFEFQGGEVFLRPDFEELVRACEPRRSYVSIVTNGLLLTEENMARLKSWGVDQLNISIDSGIPEEHDAFRGLPGTWQKAARAVELGRRRGFKVTVFTTVTHESLYTEGFDRIKDFCLDRGVVLWILIGIPVGNWAGQTDVLIDETDHAYLEGCARLEQPHRRDLRPAHHRGVPVGQRGFYLDPYGELSRVRSSMPRSATCGNTGCATSSIAPHLEVRTNSPVCLIGEDREFIASYGRRTFAAEQIPITEDVFGFPESLPPRPGPLGGEPPAG